MLTQDQINQIRLKSNLPAKTTGNYVGKFDYLKPEPEKGILSKIFTDVVDKTKERAIKTADTYATNKNLPATALSSLAVPATAINETIFGALKAVLPQGMKNDIKSFIQTVVSNPKVKQDIIEPLSRFAKQNPQQAQAAQDLLDIAGAIPVVGAGVKATQQAVKQGSTALKVAGELASQGSKTLASDAKNIVLKSGQKLKGLTSSKLPTPLEATGQVLQGKAGDIATGVKSLSILDTTGVNTFAELGGKIKSKIVELAQKVDTDLSLDTAKRSLDDLVLSAKTKAGELVQIKPVENALSQLDELYTKTGDILNKAEIKDLIAKVRTDGITKLELNNLAREYGKEFGSKAFNKMGEALTSVNAQMFENTRSQLKELVRTGLVGEEAKLADRAMSQLYNTEKLIQKNIEAVNKIKQKINERGLFEKIGHTVAKYGDILTGGSIRGLVGGLLPRGAGYKVMNALDIEEVLGRNLKVINDAIKSGNDSEIVNILKRLGKPSPKAKGEILKSTIRP